MFTSSQYIVPLPFLTLLCNRSLQEGVLPDSQKRSVVFPALKRDGLDLKDLLNFRPISSVSFLSKIIEKIVSEQITSYLSTNDLLPKYQSDFCRGHFTETDWMSSNRLPQCPKNQIHLVGHHAAVGKAKL